MYGFDNMWGSEQPSDGQDDIVQNILNNFGLNNSPSEKPQETIPEKKPTRNPTVFDNLIGNVDLGLGEETPNIFSGSNFEFSLF